ncbi:MAG: SDR family NAD(P)-dependent oxidoreductase [Gemmatimonadetes bacterium]|nr:SDR family NAD(P)-dependent oxidoreductase [Gemmatimonadota bacterium]MDE3257195.1 SDR family NAD(P)-dependent oxidoreductase [Gemmatimonadota bacterium]
MDRSGTLAFVTGAGSGIGKAIAKRFSAEGHRVIALDRSKHALKQLAGCVSNTITCVFDLNDLEAIPGMVAKLVKENGAIDVLVNNAGAWCYEPLVDIALDRWEEIYRINTTAPFILTREIAPGMLERGDGVIVNIASRNAMVSSKGSAAYDSSKAALVAFTRTAAGEFAPHNVRVNAICPGVINTSANDDLLDDRETLDNYLKLIPQGRYGEPEEIAGIVHFLTTADARFITGQTLVADGGQMAFSDWKKLFDKH